jgi:hypothetical protein
MARHEKQVHLLQYHKFLISQDNNLTSPVSVNASFGTQPMKSKLEPISELVRTTLLDSLLAPVMGSSFLIGGRHSNTNLQPIYNKSITY